VAGGTFKIARFGLQFFFCHTLGLTWDLFGKKRIVTPAQKRLPCALAEAQVRRLLDGVRNPVHRTCLVVMHACGLRIGEATTLEVTAVDRAR
jgi:site-specific recombinase XerD